jgi:hypothetical protein
MRNLAFSTFIYSLLYGAFGVLWAINTHDSNFDFSVFQMYRIVFNNLNFPHVTAWNPMTHPGNAEELHLYSTMFAPAYSWFMTIWSQWFGFSIESIRIGGVFIYFPIALI